MTRELLLARRDYFNLVHGVTVRAIAAFTDQDLDFPPRPGLRTPRELIFRIYAQEKLAAEAARSGRFTMEAANGSNPEEPSNASAVAALTTVRRGRLRERLSSAAEAIFRSMSEADVVRPVSHRWARTRPGSPSSTRTDEHWHHRGQLYMYLRLLGKEPPNLYDY